MSELRSVTAWLSSLKRGSDRAAQEIWERYYEQLVRKAHYKLGERARRAGDEEDVAQEAFLSFFRAIEGGRFPKLSDRHDLWQVLLVLVDRRVSDRFREELAEKRGGGNVRGESALAGNDSAAQPDGLERIAGREPTPETVDQIIALLRQKWDVFGDETLRQIAADKLQGFENREIAERHSLALRSVERKLQLIRRMLDEEG